MESSWCEGKAFIEAIQRIESASRDDSIASLAVVGAVPIDQRLDVFRIFIAWLLDTGCGYDMIGAEHTKDYAKLYMCAKSLTFHTANGTTRTSCFLPLIVSPLYNTIANACVMKSSPALLSVGLRCTEIEFSFIWLNKKTPCFITPTLRVVPLDVIGNIPYLQVDGALTLSLGTIWNSSNSQASVQREGS